MSIYTAKELLAKLIHLTLAGQNPDGELEWIGTNEQWEKSDTYTRDFWAEMSWGEKERLVADLVRSQSKLSFGLKITS